MEHLAERQRMEEAAMPLMLDAMWAANVLDIEGTLRSVCRKVGHALAGTLTLHMVFVGPRSSKSAGMLRPAIFMLFAAHADEGREAVLWI